MRFGLFNIMDEENNRFPDIETSFSFNPFLNHLRKHYKSENSIKRNLIKDILEHFESQKDIQLSLNTGDILQIEEEFKWIHAALTSPLNDQEDFWAIGFPMGQKICYGTGIFYDLLDQNTCKTLQDHYEPIDFPNKEQLLYSFIVEKLYGMDSSVSFEIIHSYFDKTVELQKFYKISMNNSFIDIKLKGNLPDIKQFKINNHSSSDIDWELVKTVLPLNNLQLEGFSILSVKEVTMEQTLESIKNIVLRGRGFQEDYTQLIYALKNLVESSTIEFSLWPSIQVNDRIVFDSEKQLSSLLYKIMQQNLVDKEQFNDLLDIITIKAEALLLDKQQDCSINELEPIWKAINKLNIEALALIPIRYHGELVGIIEIFSTQSNLINEIVLKRLASIHTLIAQLFKDEITKFDVQIDKVIKEHFTSLQPSVQWKFNEEAWQFLQKIQERKPKPNIQDIKFEDVHPLYGSIDIRSSTIERNNAVFHDIRAHLQLLQNVLLELKKIEKIILLEEMIFKTNHWLTELSKDKIDNLQIRLNDFFKRDVSDLLKYFKDNHIDALSIVDSYEKATDPIHGLVFKNRNALENAIQLINTGINGYLDLFNKQLQSSYPCYFEKFRSDGIEYDIYIGQSISPEKPFNSIHLKNIRLWQLTSMAAIAKITHSLLDQMENKLYTTQLIFVNTTPIDISFRADERRFDVEGVYNIRYQIIKKRIDKVTIKGSNERLTQPGKIAIVYYAEKEIDEYIGYVHYLQKNGTLKNDLEKLELEELQGVEGLHALRVSINLED